MVTATDQMCNIGSDLRRIGSFISFNPLSNFFVGASSPKIARDGDGESLERVLHCVGAPTCDEMIISEVLYVRIKSR